MRVNKFLVSDADPDERVYVAAVNLREFRGRENVDVQLFRAHVDASEIEPLRGRNLVGPPEPDMPPELLAGATEDAALECLLECFTAPEAEQLEEYLRDRYEDHIIEMNICPLHLPVPLGMSPLGKIPEGESFGFINFDLAPDYRLPFAVKGYYEL